MGSDHLYATGTAEYVEGVPTPTVYEKAGAATTTEYAAGTQATTYAVNPPTDRLWVTGSTEVVRTTPVIHLPTPSIGSRRWPRRRPAPRRPIPPVQPKATIYAKAGATLLSGFAAATVETDQFDWVAQEERDLLLVCDLLDVVAIADASDFADAVEALDLVAS